MVWAVGDSLDVFSSLHAAVPASVTSGAAGMSCSHLPILQGLQVHQWPLGDGSLGDYAPLGPPAFCLLGSNTKPQL